jgi:hypothetical protein
MRPRWCCQPPQRATFRAGRCWPSRHTTSRARRRRSPWTWRTTPDPYQCRSTRYNPLSPNLTLFSLGPCSPPLSHIAGSKGKPPKRHKRAGRWHDRAMRAPIGTSYM